MNAPGEGSSLHQQALDWVFARLAGNAPPEPSMAAETTTAAPTASMEAEPAPAIRSPEDLTAANQWFQLEKRRLEAYTRAQLARIQQEHQALIQQNYLHEQGLILRGQELARKEEMLQAHAQELHHRGVEVSQREQSLAAQLEGCWQARAELSTLRQAADEAQKDAVEYQTLLEALRSEVAALQQTRQSAQAELRDVLAAAEDARQTRAKEETLTRARQAQLAERMLAAEKAILAADQRQAELDDLECRLRREFEGQDRELRRQRAELTGLEKRLLTAKAEFDAQRPERRERELDEWQEVLAQLQAELEGLYQELQRRSGAIQRQEMQMRQGWQEFEAQRAQRAGTDRAGSRMVPMNRP